MGRHARWRPGAFRWTSLLDADHGGRSCLEHDLRARGRARWRPVGGHCGRTQPIASRTRDRQLDQSTRGFPATSSARCIAIGTARSGLPHQAASPSFVTAAIQAARNQSRHTAESILAIGGDRDGRLYLAPESDSPMLRDADAVHEDADGLLWIGTLGQGLRLVDSGRVFSFSEADGLFDDAIYGITEDDDGRLWMACSKGIFSVNRNDLRQFAAGLKRRDREHALQSARCPADDRMPAGRSACRRPHARRAPVVLDGPRIARHRSRATCRRSLQPPSAIVEDTTVNGERLAAGVIGKLPPGPQQRGVQLHGRQLRRAEPDHIPYLLEGFDKTWVNAGTRRADLLREPAAGSFPIPGLGVQSGQYLRRSIGRHDVRDRTPLLPTRLVPARLRCGTRAAVLDGLPPAHPPTARANST